MPVAPVTVPPKMNPFGVIVAVPRPAAKAAVILGVVAVAYVITVDGVVAVACGGGTVATDGVGPLILLSTFTRLCWMVGIGRTVIEFVFL